jgi:hypothetical protein
MNLRLTVTPKPGRKPPSRHWKQEAHALLTIWLAMPTTCTACGGSDPNQLEDLIARSLEAAAAGKLGPKGRR